MNRLVTMALAAVVLGLGCRVAHVRGDPQDKVPPDVGVPKPTNPGVIFVTDNGPPGSAGQDLNQACRHPGDPEIVVNVPITRYINSTDSSGRLLDPSGLIERGVIRPYAELKIAYFMWDEPLGHCDEDRSDHRVLFNGEWVQAMAEQADGGVLRNTQGQWRVARYRIPIDRLICPTDKGIRDSGLPPAPGLNTVRIAWDDHNPGGTASYICSCVVLDWVSLEVKSVMPVVFLHGINRDGGWWARRGAAYGIGDAGFLWDTVDLSSVPTTYPGVFGTSTTCEENEAEVYSQISNRMIEYGTFQVHLVAHSKGGLDLRFMLANRGLAELPADLESRSGIPAGSLAGKPVVIGLTTLSTPHDGSVLAAIRVGHFERAKGMIDDYELVGDWPQSGPLLDLASWWNNWNALSGYHSLLPSAAVKYAKDQRGKLGNLYIRTVGCDADRNANGRITCQAPDEMTPIDLDSSDIPDGGNCSWVGLASYESLTNDVYDFLSRAASLQMRRRIVPRYIELPTNDLVCVGYDVIYEASVATLPLGAFTNDFMVTTRSAAGLGSGFSARVDESLQFGFGHALGGKNHSSIGDHSVGAFIAPRLLTDDQQRGGLR